MNLNGVFHYKPSIFGGTPFFGNTHISYKYMIRWKWNQDEPVFVLHCWHRRGQDFQPDDFPPTKKKTWHVFKCGRDVQTMKTPHSDWQKKMSVDFLSFVLHLFWPAKGWLSFCTKGTLFRTLTRSIFISILQKMATRNNEFTNGKRDPHQWKA